jgi:hypothetical protein
MRTIARRLTVVVAAGAIMLMSANAASATPEPPVTTSSTAREVLDLGNGWFSNSPVTTTVTTAVNEQVRFKSVDTVESKTETSTENRTNETTEERTTDAAYKAQVLPPINPDGSSVWPAKRASSRFSSR